MENYILRAEVLANYNAKKAYLDWQVACRKARAARMDVEAAKLEQEREELEKLQEAELNAFNNAD